MDPQPPSAEAVHWFNQHARRRRVLVGLKDLRTTGILQEAWESEVLLRPSPLPIYEDLLGQQFVEAFLVAERIVASQARAQARARRHGLGQEH
jgi:hypothetical protein